MLLWMAIEIMDYSKRNPIFTPIIDQGIASTLDGKHVIAFVNDGNGNVKYINFRVHGSIIKQNPDDLPKGDEHLLIIQRQPRNTSARIHNEQLLLL